MHNFLEFFKLLWPKISSFIDWLLRRNKKPDKQHIQDNINDVTNANSVSDLIDNMHGLNKNEK